MRCIACDGEQSLNSRFVALKRGVILCVDCLDASHEVAHESEGMATIKTADLEAMRRNSFIGANAAVWVQLVRRAVEQADQSLRDGSQPAQLDGSDYLGHYATAEEVTFETKDAP
jgi:hypothetical protein